MHHCGSFLLKAAKRHRQQPKSELSTPLPAHQMRAAMAAKQREITQESYGEDEQMKVKFREVDPFDLWVCSTENFVMSPPGTRCFKKAVNVAMLFHCLCLGVARAAQDAVRAGSRTSQ